MFEYLLPVQNSEDLKSVIASFIALSVRDLAMRRTFGKSLLSCAKIHLISLQSTSPRIAHDEIAYKDLATFKVLQAKTA